MAKTASLETTIQDSEKVMSESMKKKLISDSKYEIRKGLIVTGGFGALTGFTLAVGLCSENVSSIASFLCVAGLNGIGTITAMKRTYYEIERYVQLIRN